MAIHSISLSPLGEAGYTAQMTLLNANYAAAYATALAEVQAENAAIDASNKANGTNTPHVPDPAPAIVLVSEDVMTQDLEWNAQGYNQTAQAATDQQVLDAMHADPTVRQQVLTVVTAVPVQVGPLPLPPQPAQATLA